MIKWLLLVLLIGGTAVTATLWLGTHPGQVRLTWLGWQIETSVAALLVVFTLLLAGLFLLSTVLRSIWRAPARYRLKRQEARQQEGLKLLVQSLAAIGSGQHQEAKKLANTLLLKQKKLPPALAGPLAASAHMVAAQAARSHGDHTLAAPHLKALQQEPHTRAFATQGLLRTAQAENRPDEAVRYAEEAYRLQPNNPFAAPALLRLYKELGHWSEAELFLERYRLRTRFAPRKRVLDLARERACIGFMRAQTCLDPEEKSQQFKQALALAPGWVPLADAAAQHFYATGEEKAAESAVLGLWKKTAHLPLGRYYIAANEATPLQRKRRAKKLLARQKHAAESHLLMAEAAQLSGEKKQVTRHANEAATRASSSDILEALATLESLDPTIRERYRAQATTLPPGPSFICGTCGHTEEAWHLICPQCGAADRMEWSTAKEEKPLRTSPASLPT